MDEIGIKDWKILRGENVTAQLEVEFTDNSTLRIVPYFREPVDRIVQVALYWNESLEALLFGQSFPLSMYRFAFWSTGDTTQKKLADYWRAAAHHSETVDSSDRPYEGYIYQKIASQLGKGKIEALEAEAFGDIRKPKSIADLLMKFIFFQNKRTYQY